MTRRKHLILMFLSVALVATACSSDTVGDSGAFESEDAFLTDGDDGGFAQEAASAAPESDLAGADFDRASSEDLEAPGEPTAQADDGLGNGGVDPVGPIDLGRDIIYTASVSVEVNDVAAATREASQIIASFGGLLFGQQTEGAPNPRTVLTFRVLPEDFSEALDRLGSIGTIRDQRVSADDVTERVVDLESRINTAAASVERLQLLLAESTDINKIVEFENQLLQRETNLETLRGQLRTIQDQVDLATITLTITEASLNPEITISVTSYPGEDDQGLSCPGTTALTVDEGVITTVCFEIRNVGDTPLTDITLTDPVLEISLDDLEPVFIQPEAILEPGQSAIYFLEMPAEQTLRLQTRVGAVPLDDEGNPIPGRTVADTATATIQAIDPGGVPTFAEGLEASWGALVFLVQVAVLAFGAILPFIWIPVAVWVYLRWRNRTPEVSDRDAGSDTGTGDSETGEPDTEDPELVDA